MDPYATPTLAGLPVFPLPDYYLFPGTVTPLHIFETRYRQMMRDMMDSHGRLVMAPCAATHPAGQDGPALPGLGTLVEIAHTEELEDGRWLILLMALARVSMTEVPSDRLYRKVDADVLSEADIDGGEAVRLRQGLEAALQARSDGNWSGIPDEIPLGRLADILLHALPLQPGQRGLAYFELDPLVRAGLALGWHDESAPAS